MDEEKKRFSVGRRLYLSVLSVFIIFAVAFIFFQQNRERQYKVSLLENKLLDFNDRVHDVILLKNWNKGYETGSKDDYLDGFVKQYGPKDLRLTIIRQDGRVVFDSKRKDYSAMGNHANRQEVKQALAEGEGSTVERNSRTMGRDYFYTATYYSSDSLIVRSALPYGQDLAQTLRADQHFIWFALIAVALLTLVLYRFINRLSTNITNLKIFASRADHNEILATQDLAAFPNDELGEIAERIIKIYKRLETTRKEQDMLKRQLTQNAAHELKTPVASIQGYLETIISNPNINAETQRMFLQRCYAQSERLTALLHDISTLNRLDDAPEMVDFENVDVSELVNGVHKDTDLLMKRKNMTFVNNLPAGLTVRGNRSLLYSVFRNLTDNAIAYAGEGTTVTIDVKEESSKWHFTFRDNGVGVAPEHLPRLFERFYRVDKGRSRKMGGTGLGLAIVKNAVLVHGGIIRVSNCPDGGLQFDFTLKK
ncbi:MAG: sensor histidine kinase [Prevotella sp.]|jgi:signal transduction histidine kinase